MSRAERDCVHVRKPQRMMSALNVTPPVLRNCTRRAQMTIWSVNTAEESLRLLRALSRPTLLGGLSQPSSLPQSPDRSLKGANLSISPLTFPSSSSIRAPPHPTSSLRTYMSIHYGGPHRHSSQSSRYSASTPRPVSSQYGAPPPQGYYGGAPGYGGHAAHAPPPGADPQLWQWFSAVDVDHSGSISVTELQAALVNGACPRPSSFSGGVDLLFDRG